MVVTEKLQRRRRKVGGPGVDVIGAVVHFQVCFS
jgi:hypothetical protein